MERSAASSSVQGHGEVGAGSEHGVVDGSGGYVHVQRLASASALLFLLAGAAGAADSLERLHPDDLINPFLGPGHASWLVGPVGQLADEEERTLYLLLDSDDEAAAFARDFWRRRDAGLRQQFDRRAAEADKRYSESGRLGRRTDRGMVYVLFGEPEQIEWEEHRDIDDPDVLLWTYPKSAARGLNGRKPARRYRFTHDGDVMRLFSNDPGDPQNRRRRMLQRIREPHRRLPWR